MGGVVSYTRTAELDAIADRIRERIKRTTVDIIETGNDLLSAKKQLSHGAWLPWLDSEFGWAERTARNYIAAAQFAEGKSATVADLPPATIYLLAAPSTPKAIADKVIADLEAKRPIDPRKIVSEIDKAKRAARSGTGAATLSAARAAQAARPPTAAQPYSVPVSEAHDPGTVGTLSKLEATILKAIDSFGTLPASTITGALDRVRRVVELRAREARQ